ncbi:hypothetical protein E2562_024599 [Oryza meyeriana var. granulata]|uniref:Uncharacterized protein n=1 Tax=Oryza meyeriana var. granulata TaxID=110450 RepID=A0A6G1DMJ2_9ORYZ|nr:hypothetical protein E2562_024599 [Oryza meyeriana var. granulata]
MGPTLARPGARADGLMAATPRSPSPRGRHRSSGPSGWPKERERRESRDAPPRRETGREMDVGAGAGGWEVEGEERRRRELGSLVEAIKSSEVLENRTSLINQLEDPFQLCAEDLGLVLESLLVALKCSYLDTTNCLGPFLALGAKAGSWCVRHLLWSVESIDESEDAQEEEHSRLFPEIVALTLNISSKLLPVASKCIAKDTVHAVGDFILELLTLTESSILDNKKNGTTGHIAKAAPVFLDETIKLCRGYSEAAKSDQFIMSMSKEETTVEHKEPDLTSDVARITACTIQTLCKIGTYAASSGGSQVILLNISWKGIISLLQLGKGRIEGKVNVREIILIPISVAIESLRVATETWCVPLQEVLSPAEARRAFLPIKYFLMNAIRICSIYPSEAMSIYKNIIRCALLISYSSILFCRNPQLKTASELLFELLEPSSFLLLDTLMKSPEVSPESKCQLVQYFLEKRETNNPEHMGQVDHRMSFASFGCIFSMDSDVDNVNRALLPAEFILFLHFLSASPWLKEEVVIELCKKLHLLLNILTMEDVYSYVLGCQIPALSDADDSVVWQPVYTSLIQALKTFMIAASASSAAWSEFEVILLENLFHPHFLCLEILTELWCFFVHYAETEASSYLINQLLILLKTIASPEEVFAPLSSLRKLARALCTILSYASSATIDQIYTCVLNDNSSKSSILYLALLMEGFPFDSLSVGTKELAVKTLFTSFVGYLQKQNYLKNHREIDLPTSSSSGVIGLPVHALASALQSCEITDAITIDEKSIATIFKITISLINVYRTSPDGSKNLLVQHISSILVIITHMRHLCAFSELEKLTLELHTLFMPSPDNSNVALSKCKPSMASFMAILGHLNTTEDDANILCSAMWDLFHFLLRERHWALIHLVMGSFGYFAARTSFAQLWKFVPEDAALSYNTSTGVDIDDNGFMLELKAFLEKEVALKDDKWSEEQICFLVSEGKMLKKLVESCSKIPLAPEPENGSITNDVKTKRRKMPDGICEAPEPEKVSITNDVKSKKRKMPDGICEGMMLVQNGLKIMRSALSETDLAELKDSHHGSDAMPVQFLPV